MQNFKINYKNKKCIYIKLSHVYNERAFQVKSGIRLAKAYNNFMPTELNK